MGLVCTIIQRFVEYTPKKCFNSFLQSAVDARRKGDEKVTSNNRGFRTKNPSVATYEQVKKGLSYFYPKRIVEIDGIHTQPLKL